MKISRAKVCIQCDELFTQEACPVCGRDDNWIWLSSWIRALEPADPPPRYDKVFYEGMEDLDKL